MRKFILIACIVLITALIPSCNWNIYSSSDDNVSSSGSSDPVPLFNGEAPKNVFATQAIYAGRVVLSFDGVDGADSYDIERVAVSSDEEKYDENDWRVIATISDDGKKRYTYSDDSASQANTTYYYRVKGRSLYALINGNTKADYSTVVEGWPLSPPTTLTASQGEYTDFIVLEWTQVGLVAGYNIYYSSDQGSSMDTWTKYNSSLIPAPVSADTIMLNFTPPDKSLYGKDIYFRVCSVSRGGNSSNYSGIRNGYTYVIGAPNAPTELTASEAVSSHYIEVRWTRPDNEGVAEDQSYYRWEIFRNTPDTDSEMIFSFTSQDFDGGLVENVLEDNGLYVFRDNDEDLRSGVDYTYTVRAILVKPIDNEELTGAASNATGYLVGPPTNITMGETEYPTETSAGYFNFTINEPPRGWDASKGWKYNIYGRMNQAGTIVGSWIPIDEYMGIPVTADPLNVRVPFASNTTKAADGYYVNEFDVRVLAAGETEPSEGYIDQEGETIVSERAPAPSASLITVTQNKWSSDLTANSNGVYPVKLSLGSSNMYQEYQIEAIDSSGVSRGTISGLVNNEPTRILSTLSPDKPGDIWSYRIRGLDVFGRYSEWSSTLSSASDRFTEGYGALTGNAFIKFFEAYGLKPWEFVNKSDFPQNLKTKWNKSEIHRLIDIHGMGSLGELTETSDFHNGTSYYHSYANGFAGDVEFRYTNFGELESICSNGSYKMSGVNISGNNGTCSGSIKVTGMYPATVDFSSLKVASYAFSGNYKLTQENGKGLEEVGATRNE